MAAVRMLPCAAVLDSKLYAVGGWDDNVNVLRSVERYDPALDAWEAVAPMAAARCAFGLAVLDGRLYAAGGGNNEGSLRSVERYDRRRARGSQLRRWRYCGGILSARWHLMASCTLWAVRVEMAARATTAPSAQLSGMTRR